MPPIDTIRGNADGVLNQRTSQNAHGHKRGCEVGVSGHADNVYRPQGPESANDEP